MKTVDLYEELQKLETMLILKAINSSTSVHDAARKLSVKRTTLVEMMRRLGIKTKKQTKLLIQEVAFKSY